MLFHLCHQHLSPPLGHGSSKRVLLCAWPVFVKLLSCCKKCKKTYDDDDDDDDGDDDDGDDDDDCDMDDDDDDDGDGDGDGDDDV